MAFNRNTFSLLQLNLSVLLISTSGAFGRYIMTPVPVTIAMRAGLAAVILFLFCKLKKVDLIIHKKDIGVLVIGGVLMGLHWLTYFYALRYSNIAIAMISLFTYPAITTILEPLFYKTKILKFHLLLCLAALIGVCLIVPDLNFESDHIKAVGFGLISALCYSIRNLMMKSQIRTYNGSFLMTIQLFIIFVGLSPVLFFMDISGVISYLPATVTLALFTTAIGHTLFITSLKYFSAVTSSIISCVQPVYGIFIGMILLSEYPSIDTILGGSLIVFTVVAESIRISRLQKDLG